MGKLSFEFFNVDSNFSTQGLEMKHDLEKAEKIPISKDLNIRIDFQKYKSGIDWSTFEDIPTQLQEQLKELTHYKDISDKLQNILDEFRYIDYKKAEKIPSLAERAKGLFESARESKHFKNFSLNKEHYLSDIQHTINKEVDSINSINKRTSIRDQKDLTHWALHYLEYNIMVFRNHLTAFDPS